MTQLDQFSRVVFKIGSSLIVDSDKGTVRQPWFSSIIEDISDLQLGGTECVIVSSGSVGLGKHTLKYAHAPLHLSERQAAAATGQIRLMETYCSALDDFGIEGAQVLFSLPDKDDPVYYANASRTLTNLTTEGIVPIINENDVIAPQEFRQRDNDRLAAYVARMVNADLLVLLSDVNGLYTGNPHTDRNAVLIKSTHEITDAMKEMAETSSSSYGTGGMITKLIAAKIANDSGTSVILCNGTAQHPIRALKESDEHTVFHSRISQNSDRYKWITKLLKTGCRLEINAEGQRAIARGVGLRFGHLTSVEGEFTSGNAVELVDAHNKQVGMGVVAYPAQEIANIRGFENEIRNYLGFWWDDKVILHNHLVGL